jgi:ABC-2 type transport system permease protein
VFGRGGALWLLGQELRLSWRGWWSASRARGYGRVVLYVVLGALVLFGGYWVANLLSRAEPSATPAALAIISTVFAVLATLMLSQALVLVTDAVYQRGDLDLLLSSPLPPWRVLSVRMTAVALNVAMLYLILLFAVFIWLPLFGGWRWMGLAPSVLALALFATSIGLLAARFLFRVLGARNTRVASQILAALIGAAFFLVMQAQNFMPMQQRRSAYERLATLFAHPAIDVRSPLWLPARAALGEPIALAAWLGFTLLLYVVSVRSFSAQFVGNAAAVAASPASGRADRGVKRLRGGLRGSLVRKEWRLLRRDPVLLSQVLLQLVYLAPLVFVLWRSVGFGEASRAGVAMLSGAFVFLASSLAASLVWLTSSAEDAPDLIAAAPITPAMVVQAKAFAAGAPVAALMLAPVSAAFVIAPMAGVWLLLGSAAAIASACLIGIWHQRPGDRKNFRRRRANASLAATLGQSFVTLSWAGATGLAVAGMALLSIIPALIAIGLVLALHESRADQPAA